jgi:hypothetical protein
MLRKKSIAVVGILALAIACMQNEQGKIIREQEEEQTSFDVSKFTGNINRDGRMIVEEVSEAFAGFLGKSIAEHGVLGSIGFCNENAFPFMDSLAHYYGVNLKRTALRYRNPDNKPDTLDRIMLENMEKEAAQGAEPGPKSIKFSSGEAVYYSPIIMKPLCLQCHGIKTRGDIQDEVWAKIRELYPEDVAYDFNLNELRGAWGVLFPNEYRARRGKPDPIAIPK